MATLLKTEKTVLNNNQETPLDYFEDTIKAQTPKIF